MKYSCITRSSSVQRHACNPMCGVFDARDDCDDVENDDVMMM